MKFKVQLRRGIWMVERGTPRLRIKYHRKWAAACALAKELNLREGRR